jgi:hypothetical protein
VSIVTVGTEGPIWAAAAASYRMQSRARIDGSACARQARLAGGRW